MLMKKLLLISLLYHREIWDTNYRVQSLEQDKYVLCNCQWLICWALDPLHTAAYWPSSHLTFPYNLQLGKQQNGFGARSCLGQHLSWEKTVRRNVLLCHAGEVWAHTGMMIFTGHWDKWISGSWWKLLYQNVFWPLLMKKPPDFEGASSRASAPCWVSSCCLLHLIASWGAWWQNTAASLGIFLVQGPMSVEVTVQFRWLELP